MPGRLGTLCLAGVLTLAAGGLDAGVLIRASPQERDAGRFAVVAGGQAWFIADSGLYRLEGQELAPLATPQRPTTIAEVDGEVWLGSERGVFRLERGRFAPVLESDLGLEEVTAIASAGERIAIGTARGLWLGTRAAVSATVVRERVNAIQVIGTAFWAGTSRNAYRIDQAGRVTALLGDRSHEVSQILVTLSPRTPEPTPDFVWLILGLVDEREPYCLRVAPSGVGDVGVVVVTPPAHAVVSAAVVANKLHFATTAGLVRLEGGEAVAVPVEGSAGAGEPFNVIFADQQEVWLGSSRRAYRWDGERFRAVPEAGSDLDIHGFIQAAGHLWLLSGRVGILRHEADYALWVAPKTARIWGSEVNFGPNLEIRGAGYRRPSQAGSGESEEVLAEGVRVAVKESPEELDQALQEGRLTHWRDFREHFFYGPRSLYVAAEDRFGTQVRLPRQEVWILPRLPALAVFALLAYWHAAILSLALAPFWPFARDRLPVFLKGRPLGLIELLLFPSWIRRQILRPYLRWARGRGGFCAEEGAASWRPTPSMMAHALEAERAVAFGSAERCRAFLRQLACHLITGRADAAEARGLAPVFLDLRGHAGRLDKVDLLVERASDKLRAHGELNDPILVRRLLDRGSFLFLLAGLEKMTPADLSTVERFSERYRRRNRFVLATEEGDEGEVGFFEGFARIDLGAAPEPAAERSGP